QPFQADGFYVRCVYQFHHPGKMGQCRNARAAGACRAAAHYTGMPAAVAETWVFASGGCTAFFLTLL
ncbi:MAG: hypothetical protein KGL01_00595, partial [Betaproteobacteria bacterium]|nr:hypothetical protein [Betaproteobacteria bacterium]